MENNLRQDEAVPRSQIPEIESASEFEGSQERIKVQEVHSSRDYTFMPDVGKAQRTKHRRHHHRHRSSGRSSSSGRPHVVPILITVAAILLALVAAGFLCSRYLKSSASSVKATASSLMEDINTASDAVLAYDTASLVEASASASEKAHSIQDEVNSPLWALASIAPVYGSDVRSVRKLADVAVDLTDNALVPLAQNAATADMGSLFSSGTINVDTLKVLGDSLGAVLPTVQRSAATVNALPDARMAQLKTVLEKVQDGLSSAEGALGGLQEIVPVLPAMFGSDGQTRTYLIMAQGNTEIRSAGGFPGALGIVHVTDGHIELDGFITGGALQGAARENGITVAISDEERTAIGSVLSTDALAITFTPEFSRSGEMAADFWQQSYGTHIDGVLGMDPVFLQSLLSLTGGITASDGTQIDGTNCAEQLLSEVYWRYRPVEGMDAYQRQEIYGSQDAFFVDVAEQAMDKLMGSLGDTSIQDLIGVLKTSTEERHLQIWMQNPDEQAAMVTIGASGCLGRDPLEPVIGTYANDNTWSKIDWYLKLETTLSEPMSNGDGTVSYDVVTTLTNTLPTEGLEEYPSYITGSNPLQRTVGDMITTMYFFAPYGGHISDTFCPFDEYGEISLSAAGNDNFVGTVYDHEYWCCAVCTYPGTSETFSYKITVPEDADVPTVVTSPMGRIIE